MIYKSFAMPLISTRTIREKNGFDTKPSIFSNVLNLNLIDKIKFQIFYN